MIDNLLFLQPTDTLIDLFCGCGGSGGGLLDACEILNRRVSGHFVNHWDKAIDIHTANHPEHKHYREDLFKLDPVSVLPADTFVSLLWCSPSCTFFSLARGAACVNEQDRSHAHSVTDWIAHLRPEGVILENVKEFLGWCPVVQKRGPDGELIWALDNKRVATLGADHLRQFEESELTWCDRMQLEGYHPYMVPDPARKGEYFRQWCEDVKAIGYDLEYRLLCSADYGDPTIRTRLFLQLCRKDCGKRIVWPEPTHGKPDKKTGLPPAGLKLWRTAREIINWDLHGESVFARKKKLAANTFRRLAIGLVKHGLKDFLLPSNKGWTDGNVRSLDTPMQTLTTKSRAEGLVQPDTFILPKDQGWEGDYVRSIDTPLGAVQTTSVDHLAEPNVIQVEPQIDHIRGTGVTSPVSEPLRSVTSGGTHQALAEAFMLSIDQTGGVKGNHGTYSVDEPVRTLVTKANATCIEFELVALENNFRDVCGAKGLDSERAETFLKFLVAELHKCGKVDAKPWIFN